MGLSNLTKKFLICAFSLCTVSSFAQEVKEEGKVVFNPHWFMQIQGGASHTLGEASFSDLISPAAQVTGGYQFSPLFGLRAGVSAWEAKGAWASPSTVYKYKFVQGNVDAMLDLSALFCKFNPKRVFNAYGFLGVGFNHAFDNDEAVAINAQGHALRYLWNDSKNFIVGRGGLGANIRLSDHVFVNLEVNANALSDKYNSKKAGNADWQFNGLVGLTFKFGKTYKKTEPVYYEPAPAPAPKEEPKPQPVVKEEPKPVKVEALTENIFFIINSSKIKEAELGKVNSIVDYLNKYPNAKVTITGYADAQTGTAAYNKTISQKRANAVAEALKAKGITENRINVDYKGDTVQPFSTAEENRVSICIAE